jgi:DNA polymerase III epsilon subunit-like protein
MKALIFDTETTDLISNSLLADNHQPRVIEFFGQLVDVPKGKVLDVLEFTCNPGIPIPKKVTEITGLTDADVRDSPPFPEYASAVEALLAKAGAAVAHNLSYDLQVLGFEFRRMKRELKWPPAMICTVQETQFLKGMRLSLSNLHLTLFGEEFKGAHRARQDVEALTRCFLEMHKRGIV